ncbi:MAG TPA: branched-chain amino acid ABC transporter permease [Limnochordales bacterium]
MLKAEAASRPWRGRVAAGAVLAGLVLVGLQSQGLGLLSTLTTVFLYVVLAQAWNLLGGYAGYLNLGMAVFFGVGAYTTAILNARYGIAPLAAVPAAGLASCLAAAMVGIPSLRVRGSYFAILTMILGFLAQVVALNSKLTRGAMGIYVSPLPWDRRLVEQVFYFIYLALAVGTTWLVARLERSRFGYALVAVREDEDAAQVLGVRTTWVKMAALLAGALLAGAAGGIYAQRIGYLEPTGTFSLDISIDVVLMTLVGGAGTWQGPVIGVPLVMLLAEALRVGITRVALFGSRVPTEFNRVVLGAVLIVIALYARHGVMGLIRPVRGRRLTV